MKIRLGFVGNSSSSSFIVVGTSGKNELIPRSIVIGEKGHRCFGWGPEKLCDLHSRINLAYHEAYWKAKNGNDSHKKMLLDLLRSHGAVEIDTSVADEMAEVFDLYVDHQSAGTFGMFESEESLRAFILDLDSYIQLDHDNRYKEK